uniref:Retrovirus-related Pol polyprotein from transposon TNT 1-94 n=1 Tax=Cajanus cajan TaxID=3821 RepID=A0A151R679_CAJCA|nr:Retrovirus-related Pol polyprotein from transposon TNT 1-94 [Cajanus cajan]
MQNIQANLSQIHSRKVQGRGNTNYRGNNFIGRGRSFGKNNNNGGRNFNNKPQCQICSKPRHTVLFCYQRFNPSYQKSLSSSTQTQYSNSQNTAMMTKNSFDTQSNISTHMAVPETLYDPDTGATNHVTPDSTNLQGKVPYIGDSKNEDGKWRNLFHKMYRYLFLFYS